MCVSLLLLNPMNVALYGNQLTLPSMRLIVQATVRNRTAYVRIYNCYTMYCM